METIKNLCVFTGSSFGNDISYTSDATNLAIELAKYDVSLVYGGGNRGIMGHLAAEARKRGVFVTGVLPKAMDLPSVRSKDNESRLIIVNDMHERKRTMYDLSDAFLALPGGIGTLEELFEVFTWRQLGYHKKNVGLLNSTGYYDDLLRFLENSVSSGFLSKAVLDELIVIENVSDTIPLLSKDTHDLPSKL